MATPVEDQNADDAATGADDEVKDDAATSTDDGDTTKDDAAGGGAGEATDDDDSSDDVKPIIDWKAMARKWERRAKENAKKAAEGDDVKRKLDEMTSKDQTEIDRLRDAITELQTENASNKLKALRVDVSQETGVPVELLTGTTEDELNDQAAAIKAFVEANAPKPTPKPAAAAKPKEKLRSGAAGAKPELSRQEILNAVLGRGKRGTTK